MEKRPVARNVLVGGTREGRDEASGGERSREICRAAETTNRCSLAGAKEDVEIPYS